MMKIREKLLMGVVISLVVVLFSAKAMAYPALQIDIFGGTYSAGPSDVVTEADTFSLYAYATPSGNLDIATILSDTYFLSVALTPKQSQVTLTCPRCLYHL